MAEEVDGAVELELEGAAVQAERQLCACLRLDGRLLVLAAGGQRDVRRTDRTLQRPLALVEERLRPDLARTVRQQCLPQEDMRPAARLPHRVRRRVVVVLLAQLRLELEHPPPAAPPAPPILVLLDRRLRPPGPPRIVCVRPSRPVPHTQRRQRQQGAGVREAVRRRARVARLDEEERRQAAGGVECHELGDRGCRTPARERHRLGRLVSTDAHADRGRPEGGGEGEAEGEDRVAVCKGGASPRDEDEARLGLVRKGNLELDPADDHAARRPDRLSAARTEGLPRKPFLDAPLVEAMAAPQRPDGLAVGLAVDERREADGACLSLHGFRLC
mmetsp:Transcript_30092/g.94947  ORF Transcript_30092/g.94947 Transcript_30092/m.94947 type:complete len:331 (-) Transcript_30092:178-1170(-)